jgi:hypothetical protein
VVELRSLGTMPRAMICSLNTARQDNG